MNIHYDDEDYDEDDDRKALNKYVAITRTSILQLKEGIDVSKEC